MPIPRCAEGSEGSSRKAAENAASAVLVSNARSALSPFAASASAAEREPEATFFGRAFGSARATFSGSGSRSLSDWRLRSGGGSLGSGGVSATGAGRDGAATGAGAGAGTTGADGAGDGGVGGNDESATGAADNEPRAGVEGTGRRSGKATAADS